MEPLCLGPQSKYGHLSNQYCTAYCPGYIESVQDNLWNNLCIYSIHYYNNNCRLWILSPVEINCKFNSNNGMFSIRFHMSWAPCILVFFVAIGVHHWLVQLRIYSILLNLIMNRVLHSPRQSRSQPIGSVPLRKILIKSTRRKYKYAVKGFIIVHCHVYFRCYWLRDD